jgi:hypothetical protein
MLYFSILLYFFMYTFFLCNNFLLDLVPLFIYNHYMFQSSYKAIFRWILFQPVLVTLVTNIQ